MMKKKCVIVGAGAYGQVYASYLSEEYEVAGFFDSDPSLGSKNIIGYPVLGNLGQIHDYMGQNPDTSIFVPLGDNRRRVELLSDFDARGYSIPSFIHSSIITEKDFTYGKAVYILPRVTIMPFTEIGNYCMISVGVTISHHTHISDGCFFSLGCTIGALIHIKERAYLGVASNVMTGVKVLGPDCLIGAGSVVIRDVPENTVVVGNPAKPIRKNHK